MNEYDVTQLNDALKRKFESLLVFKVKGEIASFSQGKGGHLYFQLKDEKTQIGATMWGAKAVKLKFVVQNGLKVVVIGKMGLWNERHYVDVDTMETEGEGDIFKRFQLLKEKLSKEGMLKRKNPADKGDSILSVFPSKIRTIKKLPQNIGIISKIGSAGLQDVIKNLIGKTPIKNIKIFNASVQGQKCPTDIIDGIRHFNTMNLDCIVITRGGGDRWNDLMAFDNENMAREVFSSKIPIISAVGHDVDWTLIDYVSDMRLPTPTSVATSLTITKEEAIAKIKSLFRQFTLKKLNKYNVRKGKFDKICIIFKQAIIKQANNIIVREKRIIELFLNICKKKIAKRTKNKFKIKEIKLKIKSFYKNFTLKKLNKYNGKKRKIHNIVIKIMKYEKRFPIIKNMNGEIVKLKQKMMINEDYIIEMPDGIVKVKVMEI
ncbi:MAG: exodeoxyribonuclease VII large subunit [Rickettsiales bacterium]|jgi:exodeoxyribonuclease VII large subunit|nr:exodeoxyribonuclease VII large subunit [Rickettsiales bacterium]